MAALENELTIYDDEITAEFGFSYGECTNQFALVVKDETENQTIVMNIDKNDTIMLKKWLESVIILMEE